MALACSPRPDPSRRIYFENDEMQSYMASYLYNPSSVLDNLKTRDPYSSQYISHLTYSDVLHVILAVFPKEPPTAQSLKFLAMKKVLESDLELKDLPQELQAKAKEESILARFVLAKLIVIIKKCSGLLHKF